MNKNRIKNIILGILLLVFAAGFVLFKMSDQMPLLISGIATWKLILGVVFAVTLVNSIIDISFGGMLFSLAFEAIIFGEELGIEQLVPWTVLLVALLGTIALSLIFGKVGHRHHHCYYEKHKFFSGKSDSGFESASDAYDRYGHERFTEDTVEGDVISEECRCGAATKYIRSDNFSCAEFICSCGAMEIFLDKVAVPSGQATVRIDANLCGMSIYIPSDWNIVNRTRCSLGAVDAKDMWIADGNVTLILEGSCRLSGVEIKRIRA